eukprot:jgi/Botrbrau1/9785/Bobra.85_1s0029.1
MSMVANVKKKLQGALEKLSRHDDERVGNGASGGSLTVAGMMSLPFRMEKEDNVPNCFSRATAESTSEREEQSRAEFFELQARDLEPNIGLHWYFFTEIPEELRLPFKWLFAMLPAATTLLIITVSPAPGRSLFDILLNLLATCIFKSHPSAADVALYTGLLPLFAKHVRNVEGMRMWAYVCAFVLLVYLEPSMWYLWKVAGSGNANYYYAITHMFGIWQIALYSRLLWIRLSNYPGPISGVIAT